MMNLSELVAGHHEDGLPRAVARPFHHVIAWLCAVLVILMMGLTVVEVLGRYLMNAPVPGSTELTEMLLAAIIFLGLPAASLDREHVTVDLFIDRLPDWINRLREPVVLLMSAGVLGVIAWRLWITAAQVAGYGGTTATLELPVAPIGYLASSLTWVAVALTLAEVFYRPKKEA